MRDGGEAGCDAEENVGELAQLLHHAVDLLRFDSLWVKNGFGIVEDQK
jgi:hypothetical protein